MKHLIGIDTGGTFTDCVILNEDGTIKIGKALSTPHDFSIGTSNSLQTTYESAGLEMRQLKHAQGFLHGTTITTNAMVTRKGCKVGLLTTKGHRDAIFYMRVTGRVAGLSDDKLYNYPFTGKPDPIVPKTLVREIPERIDYKGAVIVPMNIEKTKDAIQALVDEGVDAIAVSLLWSFRNPEHENLVKELIHDIAPHIYVSISSEIAPKLGEYERTITTIVNCYTQPLLSNYLDHIHLKLEGNGLEKQLLVMQSSGGVMPFNEVKKHPVSTLISGPAGGIIGCKYLGETIGHKNIICSDVGGTTFDVGLIVDGEPVLTPKQIINQYTLYQPVIDVVSIGSGGGSITSVDATGRLKVGPESAGGYPGPACFGNSGEEPTVTDADVVLGYIDPDYFLGGKMKLDYEAAERAIKKVADKLGMSIIETAAGIVEIVNHQMADLVHNFTVERGYDPRDFMLYAYGGAGPTHATGYGQGLGVKGILVPFGGLGPLFSAFGIATSDLLHVYEKSDPQHEPLDLDKIVSTLDELKEKARQQLLSEEVKEQDMVFDFVVEMRYRLQAHEVAVPITIEKLQREGTPVLIDEFEERYQRLYGKGSGFREAGVEVINLRVTGRGQLLKKPEFNIQSLSDPNHSESALKGFRQVYWHPLKGFANTPIYEGEKLLPGSVVMGPAVIEQLATSIPIYPDQEASIDKYGNMVIKIN
jgi:N-methylhydantoinase A